MTEKAAGSSPCSWTSGKQFSKVSSFATNAQRLCDPGRDVSLTGAGQERLDLGESGWRGVSEGEGGRGLAEGEEGCGGPWRRPPRGRSLSKPSLEEDSWTSRARRRGDQRKVPRGSSEQDVRSTHRMALVDVVHLSLSLLGSISRQNIGRLSRRTLACGNIHLMAGRFWNAT